MESYTVAYQYIRKHYSKTPASGIILGTGLGGLVNEIDNKISISYADIPNFPVSTVETHAGKLVLGQFNGKEVVVMQGRFHAYEGYSYQQITFPVRVMKMLGISSLFISNVAGGVNLSYKKGDLMIIEDHINLQSGNPLTGKNLEEFGPRFPDMSEPYDKILIEKGYQIASGMRIHAHKGVYAAVNGPNLETRAEYRFLNRIGADAVGMSTVPEVIVANHMGLKVFALSLITDECDPDMLHPIDIAEIIEIAGRMEPKMTEIFKQLI